MSAVSSWGGGEFISLNVGLTDTDRTDYERACEVHDYLGLIPIQRSTGFVLGDEPLPTTVVEQRSRSVAIVRLVYCDLNYDLENTVRNVSTGILHRLQQIRLSVSESSWVIFDSAYPGSIGMNHCMRFDMPVGDIIIDTCTYDPDERVSLIIHNVMTSDASIAAK